MSGKEEEIDTTLQSSIPTGENIPIFITVNINRAPIENRRKNQLRLRVFASYLATVLILFRDVISYF